MEKPLEYLCDSCVYDWRASCQVPERVIVAQQLLELLGNKKMNCYFTV